MLSKDILKKRHLIEYETIHHEPKIGLVNGLWANDLGVGGLIQLKHL